MRTFIQALSLFIFSALFISATYKLPDWLPADIYLRLDPLLGLSALLANGEIIARTLWFLGLVGATLLIGRFFCGYVCPMGATIDFLDILLFRKKDRPGLEREAGWRKVKYLLLILFLASALAGLSLAFLMDPLTILTRSYTLFFYPLAVTLMNLLLDLFRPLFRTLGWVGLSHLSYRQPVYYMSYVTLLIFAGVIVLNRFAPRFWCRFLCPLGAFLSLISPVGLFKRRVNEECNECLECREACLMGTIGEDPRAQQLPECIQCRTCAQVCTQGAIAFPAFARSNVGGEYSYVNFSRRGFLYSMAGGMTVGFLAARTPSASLKSKLKLIRPPGAIPEAEFLHTCIRCSECMKSCVTNTLQPSFWESGLLGLWTPKLIPRYAPCEQNCNVCGKVCPTQAIRSLSLEEKTHAKVGTAVLKKEECLVWAQDKLCLICDESCPYNAVVFRTIDGYRRPVVIASQCNGCGYCEEKCPVQGESAIVIVPNGEIRLKEGSYVKEAKKLRLQFKPDPGDDRFILEEYGLKDEGKKGKGPFPLPQNAPPKKPKGFL